MWIGRVVLAFGLMGLASGCTTQPWQQVNLTAPAYDDEMRVSNVAPTNAIRTTNFEAPTPNAIDGATTITTPQLRAMMVSPSPPILIDVLGGQPTSSLPGARWIPEAGRGTNLNDSTQKRMEAGLAALTGGDKAKPIVFFCLSRTCWLSHNAAARAVALGYSKVLWYRGGRNAWTAAGLPLEPVRHSTL